MFFGGIIIQGIKSLLRGLSLIISGAMYPLSRNLYHLFEYFSTFKFLKNDMIENVWNNIYVFVAVIVLFAIAIRLISSMVNPDLLTDKKNGAKNYYFRAIISVVLMFIIPILFDYSFDLQQKLMKNNYLLKHVFGYELNGDFGQVLAWETFSAFCKPIESNSWQLKGFKINIQVKNLSEENNLYWLAEKDINMVEFLLASIGARGTIEDVLYSLNPTGVINNTLQIDYAYYYHSFLCPIMGCVLVYELFLLCMDTVFRSVKLAFLELMLPIILGAYVFNPEFLKKWAKEFFSTYISLFFRVLAIAMLAIGLQTYKGIVESDPDFKALQNTGGWVAAGLFQALIMIAVLQLVKKIPNLINTIFGTNIKPTEGGIKGRLGEMAGIGGLAQKAWTGLGRTALNVGKLMAQAPLVAGFAVANAKYHRKHPNEWLRDNPIFQQGVGIAQGLRTGWKQGSLLAGYEAYQKGSEPPRHTTAQLNTIGDNVLNGLAAENIVGRTSSGRPNTSWSNVRTNPNTGRPILNPDGSLQYKNPVEIGRDITGTQKLYTRDLGTTAAGKEMVKVSKENDAAHVQFAHAQSVRQAGDAVYNNYIKRLYDAMDDDKQHSRYSEDDFERMTKIKANWDGTNRYLSDDDATFIKQFLVPGEADQFKGAMRKYDNSLHMGITAGGFSANDLVSDGVLKGHIKRLETATTDYDKEEQRLYANLTDTQKVEYDYYKNIRNGATSGFVDADKFYDGDDVYPGAASGDIEIKDKDGNIRATVNQDWADQKDWHTDAGTRFLAPTAADEAEETTPMPEPEPEPEPEPQVDITDLAEQRKQIDQQIQNARMANNAEEVDRLKQLRSDIMTRMQELEEQRRNGGNE